MSTIAVLNHDGSLELYMQGQALRVDGPIVLPPAVDRSRTSPQNPDMLPPVGKPLPLPPRPRIIVGPRPGTHPVTSIRGGMTPSAPIQIDWARDMQNGLLRGDAQRRLAERAAQSPPDIYALHIDVSMNHGAGFDIDGLLTQVEDLGITHDLEIELGARAEED